jgi:hypothetical protein
MATMADLDRIALALPGTTKDVDDEGRVAYVADGKAFCFHRAPRKDAVGPDGERLTDVLCFRTAGREGKELALASGPPFFTTPHFNGYPAVLVRIADLAQLDEETLRETVVEAWLTRAPKRVAKAWLAENES